MRWMEITEKKPIFKIIIFSPLNFLNYLLSLNSSTLKSIKVIFGSSLLYGGMVNNIDFRKSDFKKQLFGKISLLFETRISIINV
jgi:hypothetical protein